MTLMTCSSVRRRLQSFHDRELPVRELIAVEAHIGTCPPCARDLREIQSLGDALRLAAAPGPADDWTGLQPGVISRMRAEQSESWRRAAQRFIDDVHLVWIGLASAAVTVVLAGSILHMVHPPRRIGPIRWPRSSPCSAPKPAPISTPRRSMAAASGADAGAGADRSAGWRRLCHARARQHPRRCDGAVVGEGDEGRAVRGLAMLDNSLTPRQVKATRRSARRAAASSRRSPAGRPSPSISSGSSPIRRSSRGKPKRAGVGKGFPIPIPQPSFPKSAFPNPHSVDSALLSATDAVATLFMASVTRRMTLRPASVSSSTTSNSSRFESGIPSFGCTTRQRLASSEYSTRWTADWTSVTLKLTDVRGPVRAPAECRRAAGCCRYRSSRSRAPR